MVCFTDYTLTVPKSNLVNYTKYVLQGVYSFQDGDLWFLNENLSDEEKKKYHRVKLNNETEDNYEIAFRWCNFTTLANVLPTTIVAPEKSYFTDKTVLAEAKFRICTEVDSASSDVAYSSNNQVDLDPKDVAVLIKQLVTDGDIQKYFPFDGEEAFVCVSNSVPLIIGSFNGKLGVNVLNFLIFDIDDGFIGSNRTNKLNEHFKVWKAEKDITAHIIPPNDLTISQ